MSWTHIAARGTAQNKAAGTTISLSPSANIAVGRVVIAACISDNASATDGETNEHSVADSVGNTWTKMREQCESGGAANAGLTVSHWVCQVTTQIGTGDTVTLTLSDSRTAKAIALDEWSVGAGNTVSVAGDNGVSAGTSGTPSVTLSGLAASTEYLWVGTGGREGGGGGGGGFGDDADYSNTLQIGTSGGSGSTNVDVKLQTRVATLTSDTFNPTSPGGEVALVLSALLEVSGSTDRRAVVTWAEFEVPTAPRRAVVTWAEFEVPTAPRRAVVTWAEIEVPTAPRRAVVTWAEIEVPTAPRRAVVTWAEIEVPDLVVDRRAVLTWAEFEVPTAPRRAVVTWAEFEVPDVVADRRAILSWAEFELPDAPRRAILSWAEIEVPTRREVVAAGRKKSQARYEARERATWRRALFAAAVFEVPDVPVVATGELSAEVLAALVPDVVPTPAVQSPRRARFGAIQFEVPPGARRAQIARVVLEVRDTPGTLFRRLQEREEEIALLLLLLNESEE